MSNQPYNKIQQTSTSEELLEHLPTKTNASEQAAQNLTEEQLENVAGGAPPQFISNAINKVAAHPRVANFLEKNPRVAQILTRFKG